MKTIATIVGARPQFIKVAPVSRAIQQAGEMTEVLIHTGQHFDPNMSDIFFEELGISPPDVHLDIHGGGHGVATGLMMQRLEPVLEERRPDIVLIYGDTNSTLAGALTAAKLHIPVAHIEAGLRSFNRAMPEEINRIVADHLSSILFTPTSTATRNLEKEGIDPARIVDVGDVMFDAALLFASNATAQQTLLAKLTLEPRNYVLATLHRAENTDDPARLRELLEALETVATRLPVVLPLHPRTRNMLAKLGLAFNRVRTVEPLGYLDMVTLESNAALIATDSGGVQKEAFFYGVPCVTMRDETEWVELVDLGWNRLAPPGRGDVADIILAALGTKGRAGSPYGDGKAANKVAARLAEL